MAKRRRWRWRKRALPLVVALVVLVVGVPLAATTWERIATRVSCTARADGGAVGLSAEQAAVASTIVAVGRKRGLPSQAWVIALATAIQESDLRNLDHGHLDSLGAFQQRPSQGWGTPGQVRTVSYAAGAFYDRLFRVRGWGQLPVAAAAQAVQRSAHPSKYAEREARAKVLARALSGDLAAALACRGPRPDRQAASRLTSAAVAELGGQPSGRFAPSAGWLRATWLVAHASAFGVTSVTVAGKRWTWSSGRWTSVRGGDALAYALR